MDDELQNQSWKSLQQKIDRRRTDLQDALPALAGVVEFADKRHIREAKQIRTAYDELLNEEELLNHLREKTDLAVGPPKREE